LALGSGVQRAAADHGALRIAGIRNGMTEHQVRRELGGPQRRSTRHLYSKTFELQWHYPSRLTVGFLKAAGTQIWRVLRVRTRSPRDDFGGRIHVGSREAVMRRSLGGETCGYVSQRSETTPRGYTCEWGWSGYPCGPRFIFYMRHRHRRIRFIELWGITRRNPLRPSLLTLPLGPIAMRGCI
jgi:hypothetical protein